MPHNKYNKHLTLCQEKMMKGGPFAYLVTTKMRGTTLGEWDERYI